MILFLFLIATITSQLILFSAIFSHSSLSFPLSSIYKQQSSFASIYTFLEIIQTPASFHSLSPSFLSSFFPPLADLLFVHLLERFVFSLFLSFFRDFIYFYFLEMNWEWLFHCLKEPLLNRLLVGYRYFLFLEYNIFFLLIIFAFRKL